LNAAFFSGFCGLSAWAAFKRKSSSCPKRQQVWEMWANGRVPERHTPISKRQQLFCLC